jgi:FkbM family methyltransferase
MPLRWRRRLLALLPRLGLATEPLGPGAAVVARPGQRLSVQGLDERTWVVQRGKGRRRTVRRFGPAQSRTHLLVDDVAARDGLHRQQLQLAVYMATEHVGAVLRELRINCVLDVGANTGQFGKRLRDVGYTGRIVSFEPLPHLAEKLHERADPDPEWHVMAYALGDEDTEAEMTVVEGAGKTSSLLPASEFGTSWLPRLEGVGKETVRIRRLEDLFDEAVEGLDEPRVFLKMDTQGYDLRTFAGAGERIKDVLGLQSELASVPIYEQMPRMPEALATYEAAGFETTGMFTVSRERDTLRVIEFDVVMIRADAVLKGPAAR